MEYERISDRGVVFPFEDPYRVNVYVIDTETQIIICDTGCGPDHMISVKRYIDEIDAKSKQIVILNSHYHYDHVWGNCAFRDASIYSHELCLARLRNEDEESLVKHSDYQRGEVILSLPNQPFPDRVVFDNGSIDFFHSPGHTTDSVSCIDRVGKVLFVGDNVESPIPIIYSPDIDQYLATLTEYLTIDWDVLVASHDPVQHDDTLIHENIKYLEGVRDWDINLSKIEGPVKNGHVSNLANIAETMKSEDVGDKVLSRLVEAEEYLESFDSSPRVDEILSKFRRLTD